jgi:DNA-binding response OmpR family regulator
MVAIPDRQVDRRLTVYVVDDEPAIGSLVKRLLERKGIDVRCFKSPDEARIAVSQASLQRMPVDAVLLDMRLDPGSDSTEAAENLLDNISRRQPQPQVVVMSGHLAPDDFMRLVLKGATDFVSKPFDAKELVQRVGDAAKVGRQKSLHYHSQGSATARMHRDAFLSYSSRNAELALGLKRLLERMGVSTWYAAADLAPGEHWPESLDAAIHGCSVFLVLLTTDAMESEHVITEMRKAVARRELDPDGFLLIPISHGLPAGLLPERLRPLQAVDLTDNRSFVDNVVRLADRISQFLAERSQRPECDRRRSDRRTSSDRRSSSHGPARAADNPGVRNRR